MLKGQNREYHDMNTFCEGVLTSGTEMTRDGNGY